MPADMISAYYLLVSFDYDFYFRYQPNNILYQLNTDIQVFLSKAKAGAKISKKIRFSDCRFSLIALNISRSAFGRLKVILFETATLLCDIYLKKVSLSLMMWA